MNISNCPFCNTESSIFWEEKTKRFYKCTTCDSVHRDSRQLPTNFEETERYLKHQHKDLDQGYYQFIQPLVQQILIKAVKGEKILDYGCGHQPVLAEYLTHEGYTCAHYDPLFYPDRVLLEIRFDHLICCEVMEHFHHPRQSFEEMFNLLKPGGYLFCMTDLYENAPDFGSWYYKNDPTHVFFYSIRSFKIIAESIGFKRVERHGRVIVFHK